VGIMPRCSTHFCAALAIVLAPAAGMPAQTPATLRLTTMATYGWSDMSENPQAALSC
jgi:hypothetical protein